MAGNIFISYRRADSAPWARSLYMALEKHFVRKQLFMDVDDIKPGAEFAKVLDEKVAQCDVMLVLIGKGWLEASNERGLRRLDDASDFVRIEIESALKRDIKIVPVLVDGASMPRPADLPDRLAPLSGRQAFILTHTRFGADVDELARLLGEVYSTGGDWQIRWGTFQTESARLSAIAASGAGKAAWGAWVTASYVGVWFASWVVAWNVLERTTGIDNGNWVPFLLSFVGLSAFWLWRRRKRRV